MSWFRRAKSKQAHSILEKFRRNSQLTPTSRDGALYLSIVHLNHVAEAFKKKTREETIDKSYLLTTGVPFLQSAPSMNILRHQYYWHHASIPTKSASAPKIYGMGPLKGSLAAETVESAAPDSKSSDPGVLVQNPLTQNEHETKQSASVEQGGGVTPAPHWAWTELAVQKRSKARRWTDALRKNML